MNTSTVPTKKIGLFPFGGNSNPYTRMISEALTDANHNPVPLYDTKFFPLRKACASGVDAIQMYWPGNLYKSKTKFGSLLKEFMFADGLRCAKKIPLLYSVENLIPHDSEDELYDIKMTQKIIDVSRGFIVMSDASKQIFSNTYKIKSDAKFFNVPHRNYLDLYPDQISRSEARQKLGIMENKKVVLSLGRINPYKGLDRLIPSFFECSDANSLLLIAGSVKDSQTLASLEDIINKSKNNYPGEVKIIPKFIKDDELQVYFRASDVVALSYSDMPMNPGSLIMSMGFALPIIAPLKGAIPELVGPDGLFGYDESAPDGLKMAIARALEASNLDQLGLVVKDRVAKRHSRQVVSESFKNIYQKLF